MKKPFREYHTLEIFNSFDPQAGPLDLFLRNYFRAHKAIGAKDRKAIADAVYGIMRWRGLLDHIIPKPVSWENRYSHFMQFQPEKHLQDAQIPLHIRLSFPKNLFNILKGNLNEELLAPFCLACNTAAPTTIRVNALKTERKTLLNAWSSLFSLSPCSLAPHGITFHKKINLFGLPEFKQGLFEVQDEGSQLIAALVDVKPGELILDFCAGSGGKSLAIAPKMQEKGQIYLHDIRPLALQEAKARLKRAGVQNGQILLCDAAHKHTLKNKMDWVLVDAPCSGTGTLRRNPDMKWKFEENTLLRLLEEQRAIFQEALSFVKPGGKIVYATCSVLAAENNLQADFFERTYALKRIAPPFVSIPAKDQMDGFYGIAFQRRFEDNNTL
ncbi:MAG TPA: RsmB/NOP family class I SAM-dependent RNA methyltransferase [Rhabdochlamydiaceae bacterium]|jgi:16S rRNA C967 or C1407 C5-methylase (RsmB/RsmF family)